MSAPTAPGTAAATGQDLDRPADPAAPYERLADLGEHAVVAAGTDDRERLAGLLDDWSALAAALPDRPAAEAAAALDRAAAAHAQLGALLDAARADTGDALARTAAGHRTALRQGAVPRGLPLRSDPPAAGGRRREGRSRQG
ncbi:hypothetical protein AB0L40_21375, partial [Patulibacter sp. NPDC049589]